MTVARLTIISSNETELSSGLGDSKENNKEKNQINKQKYVIVTLLDSITVQ